MEIISIHDEPVEPELEFLIRWKNLEVEVDVKGEKKKILDNVSGEVNNLEFFGVLGPTGSGKTTLLNIFANRIKNYQGKVNYYSKDKKITFAYVPQFDELPKKFTVKESLLFASKVKNGSETNHKKEVKHVLKELNLKNVKNNYTSKCSGGERKRLSIALKMISKPKFLILDEPTSGLDSTTAYSIMKMLKNLKRTLMITTIHQPNSSLFQLFDKYYILTDSLCIYSGPPNRLVDHLKYNFNIECSEFMNPADLILDISNNFKTEDGLELIDKLAIHEDEKNEQLKMENKLDAFIVSKNGEEIRLPKIKRSSFKHRNHFFREYCQIFKRMFIFNLRSPAQILRTLTNIIFIILLNSIIVRNIGSEKGCIFKLDDDGTHIQNESSYDRFGRRLDGARDVGAAFLNLMFTYYSSFTATLLSSAIHIKILKKEYINSYYSLTGFFFALVTINLIFSAIYAAANSISFFTFTDHSFDPIKSIKFWIIVLLLGNLGDLYGFLLSIVFFKDKITAICIGDFFCFSVFILSGFFIHDTLMLENTIILSHNLFTRNIFESMMKTLYFDQCKIEDNTIFKFNGVRDFIKLYNQKNNHELGPIDRMSFDELDEMNELNWNRTSIMEFIRSKSHLDNEGMNKLTEFWNHKTNFLLDPLNLYDSYIEENIINCLVSIVGFMIVCYCALIIKIRK